MSLPGLATDVRVIALPSAAALTRIPTQVISAEGEQPLCASTPLARMQMRKASARVCATPRARMDNG
jgi:hypothetical protein